MNRRLSRHGGRLLAALLVGFFITGGAFGAGFSIFEQGSKAMGMAGAFTAQADDGSAMFHNVAGLAFQKESDVYAGVTLINPLDSTFDGADPFPGSGVEAEGDTSIFTPVHGYWIKPIDDRWTFGFGVNNPFGLAVRWEDKDNYPGRFLNLHSELVSFDFNPSLAWQVSDNVGIGVGIIGRFAQVNLLRRAGLINPFSQTLVDVASVSLESDFDSGLGWNAGILHKVNDRFSWGASYRSKIEIDFGGDGHLTQISSGNPIFDGAVAASLPFGRDLPITTSIEFPDSASFGLSIGLTRNLRMNLDYNWIGWSTFDEVVLDFSENPSLTSTLEQNYEDVNHYRVGFELTTNRGSHWRVGYVLDETPQPLETTGPVLPDAERDGFTLGYGNGRFDVAAMYLDFEERTTLVNHDGFFGTYNTEVFLLGFSLTLF